MPSPPSGDSPPRKKKTALWIALGCGALLLLGCVCGGVAAFVWGGEALRQYLERIRSQRDRAPDPPPAPSRSPEEIVDPAELTRPTPSSGGLQPGRLGPQPTGSTQNQGVDLSGLPAELRATCEQALACCRGLYSQPQFQGSPALDACLTIESALEELLKQPLVVRDSSVQFACTQWLTAFRNAAREMPGPPQPECQ
ncbi:MAG: hypothetical protein NZ898_10405 [Myxococcota bacterium]|nr:hypothetical protein [Myxococcota bacterium]MDW8363454.1 hypothetical protein [Myxococcales bacterium]